MDVDAPGWLPIATGLGGWFFQHVSELRRQSSELAALHAQTRAKNSETDRQELEAEDASRDKAAARSSNWVNRFGFGLAVIFAVILFPALFVQLDGKVYVETVKEVGGQLWGLFPRREKVEYVLVEGWVILQSYQYTFISIGTFLLGRRCGK